MDEKAVCLDRVNQEQVSHIPSLRACSNCIADGVQCCRTVVMVALSDCEACDKKALILLNTMRKEKFLPEELSLFVALPDVVHVGKISLKLVYLATWPKEQFGLIRALRDCSKPEIRKKLRKLLTLKCVSNKDRTDADAVIWLTGTKAVDTIASVPL